MFQPSRRYKTETEELIYIPPLNLSGNGQSKSPSRLNRSKDHTSFFKSTPLEQNTEFLKEKSLYRFAISRKGSRNSFYNSQTNLLNGKSHLNLTYDSSSTMKNSMVSHSKQRNSIKESVKNTLNGGKHFRRKTRNEIALGYYPHHQEQYPSEKQLKQLKSIPLKYSQSQSTTAQMNQDIQILSSIEEISKQVDFLKKQNKALKQSYKKKCSQYNQLQAALQQQRRQNLNLSEHLQKINKIHSDSFFLENKIENQLRIKESKILELNEKIKYLQLENFTFKKTKNEKNRQEQQYLKLQKKNKLLEEKIKVLSKIKTKRSKMASSTMSQFSELSLNLSFDQEQSKSFYLQLQTAQKTPKKGNDSTSRDHLNTCQNRHVEGLWKRRKD